MSLPSSITGVRLVDGKASVQTVPLPSLDADSVLVKIAAAPINPSDVMWLKGHYPAGKDKNAFAGLEGAGVVVATGDSAKEFQGKRVSFFAGSGDQGTWADYAVVKSSGLIPLPDAIDDEQGASALVNPLTVELFLLECEKHGHKAIVHNAAASSLGRQLIAAAKKGGKVTIINLVRRQENVDTLKQLGAEYVIDTTADGWEDEFRALADKLKPSAYFDPVAGSAGSKIISLMPDRSTTYVYGGLGDSPTYTLSIGELCFSYKVVRGLWVTMELKDPETAKVLISNALGNLASKTYQTTIYKKYPVSQFEEALKDYEANASKGKILLVPGN